MTDYAFWHAAIRGEKPKPITDTPMAGFYRKSNGKHPNKTYQPVAIWRGADGELVGLVGNREVTSHDLAELWNWICDKPISEDTWRAVAERNEPWPDQHVVKPAVEETPADPVAAIVAKIEAAAKDIPAYAKVEDDEALAKAHSLRDQIRQFGTAANKARKAEKDEYLKAGQKIDAKWNVAIHLAETKDAEISKPMNAWINEKLEAQRLADERARKEQEDHAQKVREAEAANAPPPSPPPPPPPSNLPAPSMQVKSAGARASNVRVNKIVTITDPAMCFEFFKTNAAVLAELLKQATIATNAGITVPGTTYTEEGKI